jgi:hypothetical protein
MADGTDGTPTFESVPSDGAATEHLPAIQSPVPAASSDDILQRLLRLEDSLIAQTRAQVPSSPAPEEDALPPVAERATLNISVPTVDPSDPFLTLRQWDIWHNKVTDRAYKNAHGTHAAIATLAQQDANRQLFMLVPRICVSFTISLPEVYCSIPLRILRVMRPCGWHSKPIFVSASK